MSVRILLADDSMTAQNMGKKILADAGYEVLTVSNGAAAVKKLTEFRPDIVIADVYMPGYSGLEVCERVKAGDAALPVLLSVGKMEPFRPEDGMRVKADGVIIKPFEATDLLAVTAKLAERVSTETGESAVAPTAGVASVEPVQWEEDEVEASVTNPEAPVHDDAFTTPADTGAAVSLSELPAFGMDDVLDAFSESTPAQVTEESFESAEVLPADEFAQPAAAAPTFAVEDHQPDYVREFGLLDASGEVATQEATASSSEDAGLDIEALLEATIAPNAGTQDVAVPTDPALMPTLLETEFETGTAEAAVETSAEPTLPEDDFDAKLAAALAAYDAPEFETSEFGEVPASDQIIAALVEETTESPEQVQVVAGPDSTPGAEIAGAIPLEDLATALETEFDLDISGTTTQLTEPAEQPAPVTWIAEEEPLSAEDLSISLEREIESATNLTAPSTEAPIVLHTEAIPPGPMGDTSLDDELATLVEAAAERFLSTTSVADAATELAEGETESLKGETAADTPVSESVAPVVMHPLPDIEPATEPQAEVHAFSTSNDTEVLSGLVAAEIAYGGNNPAVASSTSDVQIAGMEQSDAAPIDVLSEVAMPEVSLASAEGPALVNSEEVKPGVEASHQVGGAMDEAQMAGAIERVLERMRPVLIEELLRELKQRR